MGDGASDEVRLYFVVYREGRHSFHGRGMIDRADTAYEEEPGMFNWTSAPTFLAMLLFWMLAAYVLTRSPRSPISLTAVGAQVATACFLLGAGLAANAETSEQWVAWVRGMQWGATIAPALWYWLTLLLLAEQSDVIVARYLRLVGYPFGLLLAVASLVLTAAIYLGDGLLVWSQVAPLPRERAADTPFIAPYGPLFAPYVGFLLATTIGALGNITLSWQRTTDAERRRRFAWLLGSGLLFLIGANLLGLVNRMMGGQVHAWMGHLVLAAAMAVMGFNVAAYSLLFKGQVIRTDFFAFMTMLMVVCLVYGVVVLIVGGVATLAQLQLLVLLLCVSVVAYSLVDLGRRALDRVFFGQEVQHLRANLAAAAQDAGLTPDITTVLDSAQAEIAVVSAEHLVRLTELALRRLNSPAELARCELLSRIPQTLTIHRERTGGNGEAPTPLEHARALREVLIGAIEGLKPPDGDVGIESPGALQYHILREEYLQGLLNKQIMARHSVSEGTFHRNRRQAIQTLAQELHARENGQRRG